ncbi:MAG TPA: HD domain-containing phosphohydrolase [Anaeromyxobacter sp.]|nr:HD domain-containing phosphohydrolase [Anaeromyxobacter sp.]
MKRGDSLRRAARSRTDSPALDAIRTALVPELLLEGTPYRKMWREREARLVVVASRTALLAIAFGLVLHYFLVDLPLQKAPAVRWVAYRFGGSAFFLGLLLLYFAPAIRRTPWARLPMLAGTVVISTLEAKAVEWSPTVSYFYAFLLAVVGVLLLRQSVLGALASFGLCVAVQWVVEWRGGPVQGAELISVTVVGALLIVLFRGRMGLDVRAFLSEKRELDAQKRLIETQIELDRVKTNFFTNVSHELRTPLTLIIAPLESALKGPSATPPALRDELELALRNAQRLLVEINTLLDLSRLDARRERLQLETVDVLQVLRQLVEGGRGLAESKHVDLDFVPASVVPPFPVDRLKLEKIVLNLLSNALRFTDGEEGARGRVTVRCGLRGERFYCSVEDSGVGIPEEHLPRIFDRFHQVEGSARLRPGGTGIGLSLVKQLVDLHMGSVSVWSRAGHGSTFTVELPVDAGVYPSERVASCEPCSPRAEPAPTPVPLLAAAMRTGSSRPAESPGQDPRPLVLLVEDNRELLDYESRHLAEEYRVQTAEDVEGALARIEKERPDLIVSDLMMPGRSGADLLREIRSRPATQHLPFVLLTARADYESRIEGLEEGADDYLAKPFNPRELRARIRSLLAKGRMERELVDQNAFLAKVNLDLVLSKRKVLIETMEAFALAVEAKDPYTHGHSRRVATLAEKVCRELGLGEAACETIRIAGILHDIGKIGTPELVLKKPGRLSGAEMEVFKRHAQLGSRIVSAVTELEEVGRAILHHHERFDGGGYPDGLVADRVPLLSRILAVCDSYDAMTSDRPYRTGIPHRQAIDEIVRCMGKQFDPVVAQAFLQLYFSEGPEYPDVAGAVRVAPGEAIRSAGA